MSLPLVSSHARYRSCAFAQKTTFSLSGSSLNFRSRKVRICFCALISEIKRPEEPKTRAKSWMTKSLVVAWKVMITHLLVPLFNVNEIQFLFLEVKLHQASDRRLVLSSLLNRCHHHRALRNAEDDHQRQRRAITQQLQHLQVHSHQKQTLPDMITILSTSSL